MEPLCPALLRPHLEQRERFGAAQREKDTGTHVYMHVVGSQNLTRDLRDKMNHPVCFITLSDSCHRPDRESLIAGVLSGFLWNQGITEGFGVEWTLEIIPSPPTAVGRDTFHYPRHLRQTHENLKGYKPEMRHKGIDKHLDRPGLQLSVQHKGKESSQVETKMTEHIVDRRVRANPSQKQRLVTSTQVMRYRSLRPPEAFYRSTLGRCGQLNDEDNRKLEEFGAKAAPWLPVAQGMLAATPVK
ncbi:hypothetical protein DUI87_30193 [Hirundo rustica rustica]|uniref:Uncharacterized protein n=1 Tax=Hirundo rustica rustica TaxID=333673 RepID=A0A3M0IY18_HIRRU|nr:hypothetical protein DUI87_30193 [Hirundo rustica rustica]